MIYEMHTYRFHEGQKNQAPYGPVWRYFCRCPGKSQP